MPRIRQRVLRTGRRAAWLAPLVSSCLRFRLLRRFRPHTPPSLDDGDFERLESGSFAPDQHAARGAAAAGSSLRVSSWNICYGRKYGAILETMRRHLAADIYLLQEVDKGCLRSGRRHVARRLAEELSLHYVFGIEFQELAQASGRNPALHGQAILSRLPILEPRVLRFTHQPSDWSGDFFQPRRGGRMALVCEVEVGSMRLVVYNAHLESRGDEHGRERQLQEILADIDHRGHLGPVLVAGDLNTKVAYPHRFSGVIDLARRRGFADGTTFRSVAGGGDGWRGAPRDGRRCLDWILTRGVRPDSQPACLCTRASDHDPIWLDLRLGAPLRHSPT